MTDAERKRIIQEALHGARDVPTPAPVIVPSIPAPVPGTAPMPTYIPFPTDNTYRPLTGNLINWGTSNTMIPMSAVISSY